MSIIRVVASFITTASSRYPEALSLGMRRRVAEGDLAMQRNAASRLRRALSFRVLKETPSLRARGGFISKVLRNKVLCLAQVLILAGVLLLLPVNKVYASLVLVQKDGKVVINVLSTKDSIELEIPRRDYLEVKNVIQETPDPEAKISLNKVDGKVKLNVSSKAGEKSLDVTNYKEEIIEIEERPKLERITIGFSDSQFTIVQRGIVAKTDFEIEVEPKTAGLTLTTPSGLRFLSILPYNALEVALRAKILNKFGQGASLLITEEGRELTYELAGERVINLFNIFEYSVPVKTKISASTGEIISVDQPTWLKVLGFLFLS